MQTTFTFILAKHNQRTIWLRLEKCTKWLIFLPFPLACLRREERDGTFSIFLHLKGLWLLSSVGGQPGDVTPQIMGERRRFSPKWVKAPVLSKAGVVLWRHTETYFTRWSHMVKMGARSLHKGAPPSAIIFRAKIIKEGNLLNFFLVMCTL